MEIRGGELVVRSPLYCPKFLISKFVKEKSAWINKKIHEYNQKTRIEYQFKKSEKFLYLGEKKDLGIYTKHELQDFYKNETSKIVKNLLQKYDRAFTFDKSKVTFKFYKSKWGSCTAKNRLSFNAILSMASPTVIEYIVVHELAHTEIKNHSKAFWGLVLSHSSNYKKCREYLRDNRDFLHL
ncbi:MAG: DUF45 domain-containing protein [Candidatus Berkelbacteria bacterium]|nr:DUF45 domain-containing protein [Candidatus Berkelbacteria bacterium]